jgi:tyrosinase
LRLHQESDSPIEEGAIMKKTLALQATGSTAGVHEMSTTIASPISRRQFVLGSAVVIGAAAVPRRSTGAAPAKFRRPNVSSDAGKKALATYAKGIEAMLKLPATHPQNWFRNAFIHLMDCPHGNWWFYVWHRAYLGHLERTIRKLSGDDKFAMPYWDWTSYPQIPDTMFDGVLSPTNDAYARYTRNLADFTAFVRPALSTYWDSLATVQREQLKTRGYGEFESLWNDVTGYDPHQKHAISANMAYADPCSSRFLTRANPKLDEKTAYNVSPFVVLAGLLPTDFYNRESTLSFNSSKTTSHNAAPAGKDSFSTLEGLAHNKVHNFIGGVGPLDPGPYGYMTNFLSSVDPVFFLHHANIDRLWDVWTRKQVRRNLPYGPSESDSTAFSAEPFLFFVDGSGDFVPNAKAADYLDMSRFDYDYEPGFGEQVVEPAPGITGTRHEVPATRGTLKGNSAFLAVPADVVKTHLAGSSGPSLVAEVTVARPAAGEAREFDVLVGAPEDVKRVNAKSPYYAGTIAFFGSTMHMHGMPSDATFAIPLPKRPEVFEGLNVKPSKNVPIKIRLVQSNGREQKAPILRGVSIQTLK